MTIKKDTIITDTHYVFFSAGLLPVATSAGADAKNAKIDAKTTTDPHERLSALAAKAKDDYYNTYTRCHESNTLKKSLTVSFLGFP